jgi:5-keto 4-deoxyuronate isomerase
MTYQARKEERGRRKEEREGRREVNLKSTFIDSVITMTYSHRNKNLKGKKLAREEKRRARRQAEMSYRCC